jgi:hypothetical protein
MWNFKTGTGIVNLIAARDFGLERKNGNIFLFCHV